MKTRKITTLISALLFVAGLVLLIVFKNKDSVQLMIYQCLVVLATPLLLSSLLCKIVDKKKSNFQYYDDMTSLSFFLSMLFCLYTMLSNNVFEFQMISLISVIIVFCIFLLNRILEIITMRKKDA